MASIKLKNNINSELSIEHKDDLGAVSFSTSDFVKRLDTVNDLRTSTEVPELVWVSGYYTVNDGAFGSNIFRWNPTSTEDDNGGTVIKLASVATGRYELQYDGAVNVKWFGAKENVDSTANITLANNVSEIYIPSGDFISSSAIKTTYKGEGIIYTTINKTEINYNFRKLGNISGNQDRNHFSIGAIPRCTAGVFGLIDDAGHHPMNVTSVTQPDDYIIRVNYSQTASKINSFLIQQDAELSPYGVDIGGDVGTSYANTKAYTNWNAYLNGTTVNAHGLIADDTSAVIIDNVLIISHEQGVVNDVPVASSVYKTPSNTMMVGVGYSAKTTTVTALSDISGFLSYNGSSWTVTLTNNDATEAAFTTSAAAYGGTITLNHINGLDYNVQLTAQGTTYRVSATSVGVGNFEVAFIDNAGTVVTTPNTNMKVHFRRKALIKSTYPTSMGVSARRGNVKVKSQRFSNVTGNNFWVTGDFEV